MPTRCPSVCEPNWSPLANSSLRRPFAISIWTSLLFADAILIARRISGEMPVELPPGVALISTVVISVASVLACIVFQSQPIPRSTEWRSIGVGFLATSFWFGAIASRVNSTAFGLLVGVLAAQLVISLIVLKPPLTSLHGPSSMTLEGSSNAESSDSRVTLQQSLSTRQAAQCEPVLDRLIEADPVAEPSFEDSCDDAVTQSFSRRVTEVGEAVEGWLRVEFAVGQREATVHLSFCPPLTGVPIIEAEDVDGVGVDIRIGPVFPFGARLTIRRSGSADELVVARLGFLAEVGANQRAA